jgi:hypothetical protein
MIVWIVIIHEQRIEGVFANKKDVENMQNSFTGIDRRYCKIKEYEVIE